MKRLHEAGAMADASRPLAIMDDGGGHLVPLFASFGPGNVAAMAFAMAAALLDATEREESTSEHASALAEALTLSEVHAVGLEAQHGAFRLVAEMLVDDLERRLDLASTLALRAREIVDTARHPDGPGLCGVHSADVYRLAEALVAWDAAGEEAAR